MRSSLSIVYTEYFYSIGGHFGHEFKNWKPQMLSVVAFTTIINTFMVFNLQYLCFFLQKSFFFVKKNSARGAIILCVDSRKSIIAANILRELTIGAGLSCVNNLWTSGLISNFRETVCNLSKRKKKHPTSFRNYHKFDIKKLDFLPELVISASEFYSPFCISECNALLIPTIGVVDSNLKYIESTYPVVFNDDSVLTVRALFYLFIANYWFGRADFALKYLGISTSVLLMVFKKYFLNKVKSVTLGTLLKNWLKSLRVRHINLSLNLYFLVKLKNY